MLTLIHFREKRIKLSLKSVKEIHLPIMKVVPLKNVMIPNGVFDYGCITSSNALRFIKKTPEIKKWIFIGAASQSKKLKPRVILKNSHQKALLNAFKKMPRGSIWFPRSKRADPELVQKLRKLGFKVTVSHSYTTKKSFSSVELQKRLKEISGPAVVWMTSPSIFKWAYFSVQNSSINPLYWVALGPTTAKAMKLKGLKPKVQSFQNLKSLKSLIRTLA